MKVLSKNSVMEFVKKTAILGYDYSDPYFICYQSKLFQRAESSEYYKAGVYYRGNRRRDDICFDHRRD